MEIKRRSRRHRQKIILLEELKHLAENAFAVLLAVKFNHQFASTADGVRCEAAFILSPDLTGNVPVTSRRGGTEIRC
jgi:hypothetical protein